MVATEVVQAIGTAVSAIGLCLTAVGLRFTIHQIKKNRAWNKLSAAFTMFPNKEFADRERAAADALLTVDVNLLGARVALDAGVVQCILNAPAVFGPIKVFMNFFEDYALATKVEVIDTDLAYLLMCDSLTRHHTVLKPLIEERRSRTGRQELWVNWEQLANEWRLELAAQQDDRNRKLEEVRREFERKAVEVKASLGRDPHAY